MASEPGRCGKQFGSYTHKWRGGTRSSFVSDAAGTHGQTASHVTKTVEEHGPERDATIAFGDVRRVILARMTRPPPFLMTRLDLYGTIPGTVPHY